MTMAIRIDLSIDYSVSPRIITVASPSTTITIQDLHDTLHTLQEEMRNLNFDGIVFSAGKNDLGGGSFVGITLLLLNARLAFEARGGPSFVQCIVSGGNLVAQDTDADPIDPIEPTAFTQVVISQSTSPTLVTSDVSGLNAEESAQLAAALTVAKFLALKG